MILDGKIHTLCNFNHGGTSRLLNVGDNMGTEQIGNQCFRCVACKSSGFTCGQWLAG